MAGGPPRVAGLVLAAGRGSRLGGRKLALPWGGVTILEHVLHNLAGAGLSELLVVLGDDAPHLLPLVEAHGASWVVNPEPGRGMLSSIRCGLTALAPWSTSGPDAALLLPGDMPLVRPDTIRRLAGAPADRERVVIATHEGKRGHPVVIGAGLWPRVLGEPLPGGLRELWDRLPERVIEHAVDDPGVLLDLDTPDDYARLAPDASGPTDASRMP